MVHYDTIDQTTRVTSYSIRNRSLGGELVPNSPTADNFAISLQRRDSLLSRALSTNSSNDEQTQGESFVAFKALPVDPARARRATGSFEESADPLSFADSCKEAVDQITDEIHKACLDIGVGGKGFIVEEDIVRYVNDAYACYFR